MKAVGMTLAGALFVALAIGETAHARRDHGGPLTCGGLEVTIVGTNGDDVIDGTDGNDVIAGLGGNDHIRGGDGEDVICGGPGDDLLEGQGDEDILLGEQGDDTLDGGEGGCCNVATNTGDDVLSGGPGDDVLHTSDFPQAGNTLYGDQGNDTLYVWAAGAAIGAKSYAYGGNGDDTIYQFTGDAVLDGGNGIDLIVDWNDSGLNDEIVTMIGANGDDELRSEDSTSTVDMDGGRGHDTCTSGDTTVRCETGV
jgi:Ca2+-binding RTX toxin-like protein